MEETSHAKRQLLLHVKPSVHKRLSQRALDRSAEIGSRIGMGVVLEELLDLVDQIEYPEHRSSELFAAHD
jgi:hypothetical protein